MNTAITRPQTVHYIVLPFSITAIYDLRSQLDITDRLGLSLIVTKTGVVLTATLPSVILAS